MVAPLSSSALPRKLLSAQPEPDHPHSVARIAVVGSLQAGDKVRFRAEQVNGAYTVTRVQAAAQ